MNSFILIGYDRSGTSAISRTLAFHPQVELIYRPFNSGPIRKKMYCILDDTRASAEDKSFFGQLQAKKLDSSYFVSEWHKKYSTVTDSFRKGQLHVIITNINHFTVRWIGQSYPRVEQWAIWRRPEEILNSCIKNSFYENWYKDGPQQIIETVKADEELCYLFGRWADSLQEANETVKTAFLIAVRNYFLFRHIDQHKIVDYETFRGDPNEALQPVVDYFGLEQNFDFKRYLDTDLSSIPSREGYHRNRTCTNVISENDMEAVKELFRPLKKVYGLKA